MVADNLYCLLVGAHRSVRAETPENALAGCGIRGVNFWTDFQGLVGNIVVNAHGKMIFGLHGFEVVENSLGHAGREVLGTQAVDAADNDGFLRAVFIEGSADVLVKRLAQAAPFLGAVKNGDGFDSGRNGPEKMLD